MTSLNHPPATDLEKFIVLPDGTLEPFRAEDHPSVVEGDFFPIDTADPDWSDKFLAAMAERATLDGLDRHQRHAYYALRSDGQAHDFALEVAALTVHLSDDEDAAVRSLTNAQGCRYYEMRQAGESHNMAMVLASRKFPGFTSDSIFNEGRCNGNQFEGTPAQGDWLRGQAEAAGVSTTGKYYCSGLARYSGDPRAWIADRGDALRVAKDSGLRIVDGYGGLSYAPPESAPTPAVPIAQDLVDAEVADILDSNPGAREGDVREQVVALRSGAVDPNPLLVSE